MRLAIITVVCLLSVLATTSTQTIESTADDILSFGTRIPGSAGNRLTRDYVIDSLNDDWEVKIQKSHQNTPIGELEFQNIIATYKHSNDHAGKIVLAAHYDSKIIPGGEFLGATDSVVPISIILNLAKDYVSYAKNSKYALQLIFFDGEEAIEQWSDSDSLYGSKHLANKWSENGKLSDIKLFILLDLIGTKDCRFPNFDIHKTTGTNEQYDLLRSIEASLRNHNDL
jgi:glutaminyl-peptide cyclotransferase